MGRMICALAVLTLLGACSQVHTTSGAEYLARYEATSKGAVIDREIREAASVEPILTFPARLGIAKINQGRMVGIRPTELKLWSEIAARNHRLGEFVAVSPLIAEFAEDSGRLNRTALFGDARELVKKIRIGAARQHVDAVLVYGVDSAAHRDSTPLAFLDITIIGGAILPTRKIEASAIASALLIDVRNGYVYGTTTASAEDERLSVTWGAGGRTRKAGERVVREAIRNLIPEVEKMVVMLATELERQRGKPSAKS